MTLSLIYLPLSVFFQPYPTQFSAIPGYIPFTSNPYQILAQFQHKSWPNINTNPGEISTQLLAKYRHKSCSNINTNPGQISKQLLAKCQHNSWSNINTNPGQISTQILVKYQHKSWSNINTNPDKILHKSSFPTKFFLNHD